LTCQRIAGFLSPRVPAVIAQSLSHCLLVDTETVSNRLASTVGINNSLVSTVSTHHQYLWRVWYLLVVQWKSFVALLEPVKLSSFDLNRASTVVCHETTVLVKVFFLTPFMTPESVTDPPGPDVQNVVCSPEFVDTDHFWRTTPPIRPESGRKGHD
jgi:hypothetical protein